MYNESQLKVANLILKNKVFKYKKTRGTFEGFTFYFTAIVTGQRIMYSMGEPFPTIQVDAKIVRIEGLGAGVFKMANHLRKKFNRVEMLGTYSFNNGMDYIMRDIGNQIKSMFKVFDANVEVQTENMTIPDDVEIEDGLNLSKKKITEAKVPRVAIRNVIKDITNILKRKEEGEFYLPHELSGEDQYKFGNLGEFDIELDVIHVDFDEIESGADYDVNSNYSVGDKKLYILITIVPDRLEKSLFSILGKLNDDIPHELTHLKQDQEGRLHDEDYVGSPKGYFLQPHEIEAQYYGFKRAAKSMGLTIEELIDDYFTNNQERFSLSDKDVKEIKNTILSFPKFY
jgi:hypothetical protein